MSRFDGLPKYRVQFLDRDGSVRLPHQPEVRPQRIYRPPPPDPKVVQRDIEIVADRRNGAKLRAIGDKHGLSHERVRQIVARARGDQP